MSPSDFFEQINDQVSKIRRRKFGQLLAQLISGGGKAWIWLKLEKVVKNNKYDWKENTGRNMATC
jgi:hypothetical protein